MAAYVEVVRFEGDVVEKRMGPMSSRAAEKVDDGVNINLDHDRFYTRVVVEAEATATKEEKQ